MIQCPNCASEQDAQNQVCRYCGFVLQPGDDPAASSFLIPGDHLQNGRYVILEMLGQGGMGAVFLASDTHLLNKYVILGENSDATTGLRSPCPNFHPIYVL